MDEAARHQRGDRHRQAPTLDPLVAEAAGFAILRQIEVGRHVPQPAQRGKTAEQGAVAGMAEQKLGAGDVAGRVSDRSVRPVYRGDTVPGQDRVAGMEVAMAEAIAARNGEQPVEGHLLEPVVRLRIEDADMDYVVLGVGQAFPAAAVDLGMIVGKAAKDGARVEGAQKDMAKEGLAGQFLEDDAMAAPMFLGAEGACDVEALFLRMTHAVMLAGNDAGVEPFAVELEDTAAVQPEHLGAATASDQAQGFRRDHRISPIDRAIRRMFVRLQQFMASTLTAMATPAIGVPDLPEMDVQ